MFTVVTVTAAGDDSTGTAGPDCKAIYETAVTRKQRSEMFSSEGKRYEIISKRLRKVTLFDGHF